MLAARNLSNFAPPQFSATSNQQPSTSNMKNIALRNGLFGGLAVVAYFTALYWIDKRLFLHPALQWGSLVIYLAFMYRALRQEAQDAAGLRRDFRARVRTPFLVFILINLAYWFFYYGLHLADPALLEMETAIQLDYFRKELAAGTGDPQKSNQLREQIQYLESSGMGLALKDVLLQMAVGAFGGFALAAALTALTPPRDHN
jgi:hypothetical protein